MSSILKVDTIQDQSGNNIINENADTITIGASGDTITIPSGATLSNSGTLGSGMGKVLQVVRNSSTVTVSTSSTSLTELINTSITPSSTSSKILILVNVMMQITFGTNAYGGITTIKGTFAGGTSLQEYYIGNAGGGGANALFSVHTINEPSTTSSQQYTIGIRKASTGTTSVSTDGGLYEIILMEIAG